MALTIRDLLVEVALLRPDVKEEYGMWALRSTLSELARRTTIIRSDNATTNYAAGTAISAIAPTTGTLVRIERVRTPQFVVEAPVYQGTWNATTNTPALATPSTANTGYFYIVSVAGTQSGITYAVGDIAVQEGSAWAKIAVAEFYEVPVINKPTMEARLRDAQATQGSLLGWSMDVGSIIFYPRLKYDTPLVVTCSYVPVADIETVSVPEEAIDALIAGAQSKLMLLPGAGLNAQIAQLYRHRFEIGVNNIRGSAMFGLVGAPSYNPGFFAGTPTY
jgi:hypothetical protein